MANKWNKFKSMFVENEGAGGDDADRVIADLEKYELPVGDVGTVPPGASVEALSGQIDFQGLYDQAGIPNTDEVEALERFLGGLDKSLPDSSKVAAARAFLGAIGKAPNDVVTDAGHKIQVVRAVAEAKAADVDVAVGQRQKAIADLQAQVEEHKVAIEGQQKDLESVRTQCSVEEWRLQSARVFFGYMGDVASPQPAVKKR